MKKTKEPALKEKLAEDELSVRADFRKKFQEFLASDPPFIWIRGTIIREILYDVEKSLTPEFREKRIIKYWDCLTIYDPNHPYGGRGLAQTLAEITLTAGGEPILFIMEGANYMFNHPELVVIMRKAIESGVSIIMCGGYGNLPPELEKHAIVMDYIQEYDPRRFAAIVKSVERSQRHSHKKQWIDNNLQTIQDILKGCSTIEMEQGLSYSIVASTNEEEFIQNLLNFKKDVLIKCGLIPVDIKECPTLDEVGGMDVLKKYILTYKTIIENYDTIKEMHNLPLPKGILLFGIPGTGKSYISKAIARTFNWPMVMVDPSQIFSRFVGASEQNLKNLLTKVELMSPIVLFIDEIDKVFAGVQSSNISDAGTTAKVFGMFLTWMQEFKQKIFVVATANSITNLPAPLKRRERFDQIFFVDLPTQTEAEDIFRIHLKKYKVDINNIDVSRLAQLAVMKKLTGAEIEASIKDAVSHHCVKLLNNEESSLNTDLFINAINETKGIADDTEIKILKKEAEKIAILASSKRSEYILKEKEFKDFQ